MAGRPDDVKKAWVDIRKAIATDEPTEFGEYLGCSRKRGLQPLSSIPRDLIGSLQMNGSETVESLAAKTENILTKRTLSACDAKDVMLPSIQYDMAGNLEQCVELYLDLADCDEHSLKFAPTPSLDDNAFTDEDLETSGKLGSHAAKIIMKILCCPSVQV